MKENQTFNEMMVHTPLCTHKEAQNVLIIGDSSEDLRNEASKHTGNIEFGDVSLLTSKDEKNIDVIIFTDVKLDEMLLANIERVLKIDGVVTFKTSSFGNGSDELKKVLALIGRNFWIAMPFKFGHSRVILAFKK